MVWRVRPVISLQQRARQRSCIHTIFIHENTQLTEQHAQMNMLYLERFSFEKLLIEVPVGFHWAKSFFKLLWNTNERAGVWYLSKCLIIFKVWRNTGQFNTFLAEQITTLVRGGDVLHFMDLSLGKQIQIATRILLAFSSKNFQNLINATYFIKIPDSIQ